MQDDHEIEDIPTMPAFDSDPTVKAKKVAEIKEDLGMPTVQLKAAELVDKTFIINKARSFVSSFEKGSVALYCICVDLDTGELFSTVLGGQGVVDILDLYFSSGQVAPIEVTLKLVKAGRFGRYYVLE